MKILVVDDEKLRLLAERMGDLGFDWQGQGRNWGGVVAITDQRLQTQMEAEYSAMQSAGQDSQSQLNRAIEQMKQDVQGQGEETTLAESPWKGPLDPEGEVY